MQPPFAIGVSHAISLPWNGPVPGRRTLDNGAFAACSGSGSAVGSENSASLYRPYRDTLCCRRLGERRRDRDLCGRGRPNFKSVVQGEKMRWRASGSAPVAGQLPDAEYFVFLSRAKRSPVLEIWPIRLGESLPTVPVPLLSHDADVALDLQLALTSVYDALRYDLEIDYRSSPDISFTKKEAALAAAFRRTA